MRKTQTGFVRSYALSMLVGAVLLVGALLLVRI
jgi:NADH-quinone oxidoreductase subunit L